MVNRKFLVGFLLVFFSAFILLSKVSLLSADNSVRVWVQFKPGQQASVENSLQSAGGTFHYTFEDLDAFVVTLPQQSLQGIAHNPNVVAIEDDVLRRLFDTRNPVKDAFVPENISISGGSISPQAEPWGIGAVQAQDAWATGQRGSGITVCIIDTGLYTAHEDFPSLLTGISQIAGESWFEDGFGHGTHVAGTIAAVNNGFGVVGVSPDVYLYIVKVFNNDGAWTFSSDLVDAINSCEANSANIISMSLGGDLKNRFEQVAFDNLYANGILHVAAAGNDGNTRKSYPASYDSVISVAAVDSYLDRASFSQQNGQVELAAPGVGVLSTVPFIDENSITVGATTYFGNHIEFSGRSSSVIGSLVDGGLCDSVDSSWSNQVVLCERGIISFNDKVQNAETGGASATVIYNNDPGNFFGTLGAGNSSGIPAISLSQADGLALVTAANSSSGVSGTVVSSFSKPASGYEAWNGTSMATPHVSAVAALLWGSDTSLSNVDIRDAMGASALDLGTSGRDNAFGYGLVQAKAALDLLSGSVDNPPTVNITSPLDGATVSGQTVTISVGASDDNGVVQVDFYADGTLLGSDSSASYGWVWDSTTVSDGNHTLKATAIDTDAQSRSNSVSVLVDNIPDPPATNMHVASIAMSLNAKGPNTNAIATVTVVDVNDNVGGAVVFGHWEEGLTSDSDSGVTDGNGSVSLKSDKVRNANGTFTFHVDDITKDGWTYEPVANIEISDSITVP